MENNKKLRQIMKYSVPIVCFLAGAILFGWAGDGFVGVLLGSLFGGGCGLYIYFKVLNVLDEPGESDVMGDLDEKDE